MRLGGRLYQLLTRVMSLRIIVILAALSVVALVITLGAWVWFGVTNDQYSQLDRRLDSVSSLGDISTLLRTAQQADVDMPVPDGALVRTARVDGVAVSIPENIVLPRFDIGYANTTIDGVEYRVRTFAAGDALIAIGAPLAETQRRIDELHRRVLLRRRDRDPARRREFGRRRANHRRRQRLGIPEHERAAVFERFSRGSTAARSGSGLGLALVAQQAELHGGSATMETSPLGGARLVLRLPAPS